MSALYTLCVKLLMWVITAILCLNESLCVQFGVGVVISSTHYIWLAILMWHDTEGENRRVRERQRDERNTKMHKLLLVTCRGSIHSMIIKQISVRLHGIWSGCKTIDFFLRCFKADLSTLAGFKQKPAGWQNLLIPWMTTEADTGYS